eukprot:s1893_g6.t1
MFCQTLKGSDTLFRYWRTLAEASQSNVPLCAGGGCPIVGGWRLWCCRWYWPPQASVVVVAAARRWLCQQHLASRWAEAATAAVRLQALVRGWLCRRFVAAERQRQEAACTVKSFLQRWLSRKALLDALVLQDDAPAAEVDDDSLYSSDYEAGSSPSRSRAQSPTAGSGASSWDPFIAALKGDSPIKAEDQMTTSDHVTQGPSSPLRERHASRWEGVSSPHWRANLELPDLCEPPEILQAPARDFQLQAETFVTGAAGAVFACAKRSQWQQTLCALEDLWPREIRVYSAAINALARSAQWRAALQLFRDLIQEALQPDVVLFGSLCKACALASRWAQASQLFREAMRTADGKDGWSLQPDVILFSTCLSACSAAEQWLYTRVRPSTF